MATFKAFAAGVEVNGETVLSVIDGMGPYKQNGEQILRDNGINDAQAGKWYPQQAWLNAFKSISEKIGVATLLAIGKTIPENAQWPPQIDTIEKALGSIDMAYHMNHRGGDIGSYKFESTGTNSGKMICNNPYPSEFDQGIIYAVARKFAPKSVFPSIKLDEHSPTRKNGADSCTFLITW